MLATLVGIGGLSLLASVVFTRISPNQAFFVTFTRAWEFAAGGTIALLAHRLRPGWLLSNLLSFGCLAAIGVAAFAFVDDTQFPGAAALVPVVGTAAIIAGGGHAR